MRIVYFDIDSLRPDHLGCYGYERPTSPTIDSIAAQGMRFDRYYCSDSPCMPSRHALLSGRFGINNGVVTHGGPASRLQMRERLYGGPQPENQLLPRRLRENGLETICFSNFRRDRYPSHRGQSRGYRAKDAFGRTHTGG